MGRHVAAVIFDFDLTLADSSAAAIECTNFALRSSGYPEASSHDIRPTIGLSLPHALRVLTGEIQAQRVQTFSRHFVARADQVVVAMTEPFPGVCELFGALRREAIRIGIVSTKYRYRIEAILRRWGCEGALDAVIGGEDVPAHKPDPAGIVALLKRWSLEPGRAIYVGDHPVDVLAAGAAGVPFVGVLTGATSRTELEQLGVQHVLSSVAELPRLLGLDSGENLEPITPEGS